MRVLVIEDEPRLAANIVAGLREAGFAVDHAADGIEGLAYAEQDLFDLIVLDLMLPGRDGKSVLHAARCKGVHSPVLILTAQEGKTSVIELLNLGADDYLAKPFDLGELIARVKALIRRSKGTSTPVLRVAGLSIDTVLQTVSREDRVIDLSPTEFRILEYLAYRPRAVVSKKELLEHLYDYDWEHHSNVIEAHISNLRRKLLLPDSQPIIETLRHRGYRLYGEVETPMTATASMTASASIAKRLTLAVLLLEFLAALVLIATVGIHERHVQLTVFQANLRANANTLFGALQEADARDGSIVLDLGGLSMPRRAVYRVSDGEGHLLGEEGLVPEIFAASGTFTEARVGREPYMFYVLTGDRAIDPGKPFAVNHHVRVTYGLPTGRVWHETFEAVSFFSLATLVLLGMTALLLTWLIRHFLHPIRELAVEADKIDSDRWSFHPPASSRRLVELRPLASAIERSLLRLQGSFQQQRRFTSDAAHELKTDLAIVKSSFQLLKMKRRTVEEYEEGLSLGLDDIQRLERTVQKMLTLARLEQAPRADNQRCEFAEAVLEAIAQSEPLAALKDVAVEKHVAQSGLVVGISKEDALLLCSNVLVNALQYSPAGQSVQVAAHCEGELMHLLIRDYGSGLAKEDQPFLFDAFYRGDASRSRNTGGTGLGLSICRAICVRAGGSISIENHPEGGAVVEIRLPLISSEEGPKFSHV